MKLVMQKNKKGREVLHAGDVKLQKPLSGEVVQCCNHPVKPSLEPVQLVHAYECGQIQF